MTRSYVRAPVPDGSPGRGARTTRHADVSPIGFLSAGFITSAFLTFAAAAVIARAVGVHLIPLPSRLLAAALVCALACALDIDATRSVGLCRVSKRRQTPKNLVYQHGSRCGPFLWGLDTGSAVTTFRVSAATWALFGLCLLQLAPWWSGLAFGLGFTLSLSAAILLPRWRPPGEDGTSQEPMWLVTMLLGRRRVAQLLNVAVLAGVTAVLVVRSGVSG